MEEKAPPKKWGGARPGSGRKPKTGDEVLNCRVIFRLTETQRKAIEERAGASEGINLVARRLLLEHLGFDPIE